MKIETLAIHAGETPDLNAGAITSPIYLSTTYERAADGSYPGGHIYGRSGNPNRNGLEECLATLEGGAGCAAFGSGMAAIAAVMGALDPGDHVIAPTGSYYGTGAILRDYFTRWGLTVSFVDISQPQEVEAALTPATRLVWLETPTNPLLKVVDISLIARMAHDAGALCICDNTLATPILQCPLGLGADLVMHSTTKYLAGHSDVIGGAVIAREDSPFFQRVRSIQSSGGAVPSPFDCWLLHRSIKTLPYRVRAHAAGAEAVARFLAAHPRVEKVHYPGLKEHPGHEIAARQMSAFGGMVSVQVQGGREEAMGVAARTRIFMRATSLGGVHSLIEHRASMEAAWAGTPENLLRLSVGLEHPDDLVDDLTQALG